MLRLESTLGDHCLRLAFELATDAFAIADEDGYILDVNRRAEQMFGYSREELIGKTLNSIIPESIPISALRSSFERLYCDRWSSGGAAEETLRQVVCRQDMPRPPAFPTRCPDLDKPSHHPGLWAREKVRVSRPTLA